MKTYKRFSDSLIAPTKPKRVKWPVQVQCLRGRAYNGPQQKGLCVYIFNFSSLRLFSFHSQCYTDDLFSPPHVFNAMEWKHWSSGQYELNWSSGWWMALPVASPRSHCSYTGNRNKGPGCSNLECLPVCYVLNICPYLSGSPYSWEIIFSSWLLGCDDTPTKQLCSFSSFVYVFCSPTSLESQVKIFTPSSICLSVCL